jgi:predicted nucleic acid-binding protein
MPTTSKVFFDANILLYSIDGSAGAKQKRCQALLEKAEEEKTGVISTQVLQEFYSIATRKFKMDPLAAKEALIALEVHEIVVVSPVLIQSAVDCQVINKISFWDALIVVAAEAALCESICTEDLNSGQRIRGMRIENPFQ